MRAAATLLSALLLTVLPVSSLLAQEPPVRAPGARVLTGPGRIAGSVSDTSRLPLSSAAVTLRSAADSALVTGVMTDQDGNFRIEGLAPGQYLLRVSLIGYKPRSSEVIALTQQAPTVELGAIALETSVVQLDAVEATAERAAVVIEADRTVYNTKSMPVASTGNATDVLRAVPELEVDVNDNVKLRGNQSVAIHLNGRPAPLQGEQLANFLRQLPGNRIQRVEVMPNPSAKHDPEGMGGIVNIVLQDDLDLGLSGSLSANASTRNRQYYNGRLNFQRGRLTLFSGAGINTYQDLSTNYDLRQNLITVPVTSIEQNSTNDNQSWGWNGDWTAELRVGKQATLWSNAWLHSSHNDARGTTEYGILDNGSVVRERYDRDNDSDRRFASYNFGLGFKQIVEPQKEELTIDGRFSSGVNDTETRNERLFHILAGEPVEMPLELTLNDIDSGNGNLTLQADYFRPLGSARLDVGYRAYKRDQDNDNQLRIFADPAATDPREQTRSGYDYEEVFHSLYGTYGRTLGKFALQAGVRAERSSTRFASLVGGASFERTYNTFFPSFNVSYSPVQGRTVRFLYSKRISRPSAFVLDPFVPATDPLNRFHGNPDLRPSYTHSYSLDFSLTGQKGTLRVGPYYRRSSDVWERIRTVDTAGVATSRWENAAVGEAYGSSFTISLPPTGRLSGSTNFNLYRDVRDGTNISSAYRRSAFMWSMGGNLGVKLTETLTAQAYANYFPTQSILQGRASGYMFNSIALRQQLWGTKGTLSLNINDPLNLFRFNSSTSDATYIQNSRSSYKSRVATLGFSYNFGKPPQQQSRRGGAEEVGETIRVR
jgi:hypothetical protein